METQKVFNGVPSLAYAKAEKRRWLLVRGPFAIDIDMDGEDGMSEFDVDSDVKVHISLGKITRKLLLDGKYPELVEGELFAVSDVLVDEDKKRVTVVGNIIKGA